MPKIRCTCEATIGVGEVPGPNQYMMISDVEYDNFEGMVNAEEVYAAMTLIAKCPECGRLHVFWNGFDKPQTIYKIDEQ